MNRREFLYVGAAASGAALVSRFPSQAFAESAPLPPATSLAHGGMLDVGDRAQLFVDLMAVGSTERIAFTVHPARKHPLNPLIKADQPWEGWWVRILGGSVLFDEDEQVFKMWYLSSSKCFPDFGVHYARSRDGVHWEKPLVGTIQCAEHAQHNVVLNNMGVISVMRDAAEADSSRRYKMIGFDTRKGTKHGSHAFISPDGLTWNQITDENIFSSSDVLTAFFDRKRGRYVAFPKVLTAVRGFERRRCFGVTTSADLLKWSDTRMVFVPDVRDDASALALFAPARASLLSEIDPNQTRAEFYGVGIYQAESCVIAFPWVFAVSNRVGGKDNGVSEIQLASSRDLETWDRTFRTPVIPLGPPGSWNCGFQTTAVEAFRHKDEVFLYYSGQNYSHANPAAKKEPSPPNGTLRAIGLASWPLDRFVSADAGTDGGQLTTVAVRFSGRRLEVNADAGNGGQLRVELLDAAGRPLEGYGASDPLTTDGLRTTVTWTGNSDVSKLAGSPVILRFNLQKARLYSFAFRQS